MKIALIGYGKMGKTIHQLANENGDEVTLIVDQHNKDEISKIKDTKADVAIEFTNPESAFDNIKSCLLQGIPVISGTTGWLHQLDEIKTVCKENDGSFMYASNFSIGVNVFFELNKFLARKMSSYLEYKCSMEEIHHTEKLDAPSGTAITLAEGIIGQSNYTSWKNEETNEDQVIPLLSSRIPNEPGTHIIKYTSDIDEVEIRHTAFSRLGFARGAYDAARWIISKKGVFTIQDMLFGNY